METLRKKYSMSLVWCLFLLYAISTFTKLNYSASIAYIVKEGIFSKTHSGIIVSAFYLLYGGGQLLGARIIDRFSPYNVELWGLCGSLLCNIALCFSHDYIWVLIIWSINGIALCVTWPSAVRMVSECVLEEHRRLGSSILTTSIAFGGFLSYSVVSPILERFGWSGVFILNSAVTLAMILVWMGVKLKTEKQLFVPRKAKIINVTEQKQTDSLLKLVIRSGVVFVLFICFIRAVLDNGLKTWIPTMMMESYNISTVWAGLQTALIYICNAFGVFVIIPLVSRFRNEMKMMAAVYALIIPFMIIMLWIGAVPQTMATASLILITSLSYALNSVQVMVSAQFAAKGIGHSGAIASLLNAFASFGVLVAGALFGFIAEHFSWQAVVLFCLALTVLALVLTAPAYTLWKKFLKK